MESLGLAVGLYADLEESLWNLPDLEDGCNISASEITQHQQAPVPLLTSLSFFPGARDSEANVVFCTADCILFYADTEILVRASKTAFQELLKGVNVQKSTPSIVFIPETSCVLDVMLHLLYHLTFSGNIPLPKDLIDGIGRMPGYGIDPFDHLTPSNPCYEDILNVIPLYPLELYTLAAKFGIRHLAVTASSYLLSQPLNTISDEAAGEMGASYLQQLFLLHAHRLDKLKSILEKPPHPHEPTKECDFTEQKKLARAWMMIAGYFIWESKSDLSPQTIQSQFENLDKLIGCNLCRRMMKKRVREVISQWVLVRRTI